MSEQILWRDVQDSFRVLRNENGLEVQIKHRDGHWQRRSEFEQRLKPGHVSSFEWSMLMFGIEELRAENDRLKEQCPPTKTSTSG